MVLIENANKSLLQIFRETTGYTGSAKTNLLIGELAFGTRFYDERIAEGLNAYLRLNGYGDEIDRLILGGGLLPEFPPLYSVTNAERMRMLGTDSRKEGAPSSSRIEQILQHVWGEKEAARFAEYREKWLEQKVNTWDDCKQFAKRQLEVLLDGLGIPQVDYCQGEEDRFNQKYEEELRVNRLAKEAGKYLKGIKEQVKNLDEACKQQDRRVRAAEERYHPLQQEFKALSALNTRLRAHLTHAQSPDIAQYMQKLLQEEPDKVVEGLHTKQQREELLRRLREVRDEASFTKLYDDKKGIADRSFDELKLLQREAGKMKKQLGALEEDVNSLEREVEQGGAITIFTKRSHITPIEAEWLYASVKDKYTEDILECFGASRDKVKTHISGSAKVRDVHFGDGKEELLEEADVALYGDILVMHNTRFRSNSTTLYGLSDAQKEVLWRKVLEKVGYEAGRLVPKTVVAVHGAGGFAVTRMNTTSEFKLLDGSYREDPEVTTIMTLPVFQSTDNLLRFYDKHLNKTWGEKRFAQHVHGSGAVLQTILEDGSELYEFVDTSSLLRIADKKRELEKLPQGSEPYTALEKELQLLCSKTLKLRATLGDAHFGAANFPGTPTNYERTARTINYLEQRYAGKLDDLLLTEFPDGVLPHTGTDRKFFGKPLPQLRKEITAYLQEKNLKAPVPLDEFAVILEHVIGEFSNAMAQNAVPNLEQQYEIIRPYIEELVRLNPQRAILISGNHPRSLEGADEATRLADLVRAADRERKVALLLSDAIGHKFGGQGGIANEEVLFAGKKRKTGKKLGFYHEPQGGKNAMPRTLDQLLSKGVVFDEFFAGHIHQLYAAYANGAAVTINPPLQGPTDYSEHLPVKPSLYGTIVKFSNVAPEGHPANAQIWHAWHLINDNTLERPEFRYDSLERVLQGISTTEQQGKLLEQWKTLDKDGQRTRLESVLKSVGGNVSRAAQSLGVGRNFLYEQMGELSLDPNSFRPRSSPLEQQEIKEALEKTNGNLSQAAALLHVNRVTLYRWMKRLGISTEEKKEAAAVSTEGASLEKKA